MEKEQQPWQVTSNKGKKHGFWPENNILKKVQRPERQFVICLLFDPEELDGSSLLRSKY